MASTNFTSGTTIASSWLNDVNTATYVTLPAVQTTANAAMPTATLAASGGSSLVGFIQAGTGAVARAVQAKLREAVSPKDFGAKGDGTTDDTSALQATLNYAVANNLNILDQGGSRYKISATLIVPQHFNYNYLPITLDFGGSAFVMAADVPTFTSGYTNGAVLVTNFGTPLLSKPSNGITLRRIVVESSIGNLTSPVIKIQDWLQGTIVEDIYSGVNYRMILASDCFYAVFRRVYGTNGNAAVPMNVFTDNCNLMRLENFVAVGASIAYQFTGPVTALVLKSMSFETATAGVGAQFDAAVYDLCIEDSYCELGASVNYTAVKFGSFVYGATFRNNYFNFNNYATGFVVEYVPNSNNNIRITTDNAFVNFPSNSNIIKNKEDVYGRGIIVERSTAQGTISDTLVNNAIFGANIDWRQKIALPSGAIANVVNGIIPGNYSGAYTTTFVTQATGFVNNSSGTTLTLNTKIAQSFAMRVAVSLHFVINGVDYFTFGEIVPTGYNTYAYFAYTAGSFAPSLIINASFVGGFLQINGTAGVNGLGTANPITAVTGEIRVI